MALLCPAQGAAGKDPDVDDPDIGRLGVGQQIAVILRRIAGGRGCSGLGFNRL